jgi:hypothetical protein
VTRCTSRYHKNVSMVLILHVCLCMASGCCKMHASLEYEIAILRGPEHMYTLLLVSWLLCQD